MKRENIKKKRSVSYNWNLSPNKAFNKSWFKTLNSPNSNSQKKFVNNAEWWWTRQQLCYNRTPDPAETDESMTYSYIRGLFEHWNIKQLNYVHWRNVTFSFLLHAPYVMLGCTVCDHLIFMAQHWESTDLLKSVIFTSVSIKGRHLCKNSSLCPQIHGGNRASVMSSC